MCTVVAALVAQTGLQLMQTRNETKAQVSMLNAQAEAADMNKRISDRKQEQIAEKYLQEKEMMNDRMRLIAGQNAAAAGASGLTMEGSPLDVLGASYDGYQKDVSVWEQNKNTDIYDEYLRGVNYQNEANMARASAANAKQQGRMKLFGTILGAASSYATLKQQYGGTSRVTTKTTSINPTKVGSEKVKAWTNEWRNSKANTYYMAGK